MIEKEDKILLAIRKANGQIGYLSEGVTIPAFYELIQPKINNNILIDFSPIIDKLYTLHNKNNQEKIYIDYASLYNYFLDMQTYSINKENRLENVIDKTNNFINLVKSEINNISNDLYKYENNEKNNITKKLSEFSNLYLDAILIFIYSKALLDIKSFTKDVILTNYIKDLKDIIYNIYEKDIRLYSGILKSDFILYILFEHEKELLLYLDVIENLNDEDRDINLLKLQIFNNAYSEESDYYTNKSKKRVYTEYQKFDYRYKERVTLLMEILHKIKSINELLDNLKNKEIHFESNENYVQEIKQLINTKK